MVPELPQLVAVSQRFTGRTIEEALGRFERECSEENVDSVVIEECIERADGIVVRYEVRWNVSIFDDHPYGQHVSWALVVSADAAAGDPPDARFRVAAAVAERHMK